MWYNWIATCQLLCVHCQLSISHMSAMLRQHHWLQLASFWQYTLPRDALRRATILQYSIMIRGLSGLFNMDGGPLYDGKLQCMPICVFPLDVGIYSTFTLCFHPSSVCLYIRWFSVCLGWDSCSHCNRTQEHIYFETSRHFTHNIFWLQAMGPSRNQECTKRVV